jgi:hypothetical protein
MHRLTVFLAGLLGALALLVPLFTLAQTQTPGLPFFSFGGRIVSMNVCLHGALNVIIRPAGLFDISYVWSPPPLTLSVFPAPPVHIGQQVLGLAAKTIVPCIGFGTHPPIWYGWQVIYGGASPPSDFVGV